MSGRAAGPPPSAPDRMETRRLLLTRPAPGDLDDVHRLLGDRRVGAWLGGTLDREQTAAALRRWSAHWEAHGFGLWVARERDSGQVVGRGGLLATIVHGAGAVEAGWAIAPSHWHRGLATELGAAAIDVAERDLGLRELVSFTLPDNAASLRVMEKLGFGEPHDIVHRGLPHVLCRRVRRVGGGPPPAARPG